MDIFVLTLLHWIWHGLLLILLCSWWVHVINDISFWFFVIVVYFFFVFYICLHVYCMQACLPVSLLCACIANCLTVSMGFLLKLCSYRDLHTVLYETWHHNLTLAYLFWNLVMAILKLLNLWYETWHQYSTLLYFLWNLVVVILKHFLCYRSLMIEKWMYRGKNRCR